MHGAELSVELLRAGVLLMVLIQRLLHQSPDLLRPLARLQPQGRALMLGGR